MYKNNKFNNKMPGAKKQSANGKNSMELQMSKTTEGQI